MKYLKRDDGYGIQWIMQEDRRVYGKKSRVYFQELNRRLGVKRDGLES